MDQQECQPQQKPNHQLLQHVLLLGQKQRQSLDIDHSLNMYYFINMESSLDMFLCDVSEYLEDSRQLGRSDFQEMWECLYKMYSTFQEKQHRRRRTNFAHVEGMMNYKQLLQGLIHGPEPIHDIASPVMASPVMASILGTSGASSWEENSPIPGHQKDGAGNESIDIRCSQGIFEINDAILNLKTIVRKLKEEHIKFRHFIEHEEEEIALYLQKIQAEIQNNVQNQDLNSSQDSAGGQG